MPRKTRLGATPRKTVRAGHLKQVIQGHDSVIAQKTGTLLQGLYLEYVQPLERRVLVLETLTTIRFWRWLGGVVAGLWRRKDKRDARPDAG